MNNSTPEPRLAPTASAQSPPVPLRNITGVVSTAASSDVASTSAARNKSGAKCNIARSTAREQRKT
eukprot:5316199-Alexandrium_andersonii.AAC.1